MWISGFKSCYDIGGRSGIIKFTKARVLLAGDTIPNSEEVTADEHSMSPDIREQLKVDTQNVLSHAKTEKILPNVLFHMDTGVPFIELTGGEMDKKYLVEIIDKDSGAFSYSAYLMPYYWATPYAEGVKNWEVRVSTEDGEVFFEDKGECNE